MLKFSVIFYSTNSVASHNKRLSSKERNLIFLTLEQKEILVGLTLGDATLQRRSSSGNTRLLFTQSLIHSDFFFSVFSNFQSFCSTGFSPEPVKLKVGESLYYLITFTTLQLPCFNYFYEIFYPNGKKVVPANLANYLTPLAFSHWIMCDGSKHNSGLHLNTYGFTIDDINLLIYSLNINFNINCTIHNHKSGGRIYINKADLSNIKHLLIPHIHSSMMYKIT